MEAVADKTERKMEVSLPIKVKSYEIDVMGIVSNINYIKYFEDIRTEFLDRYYPYDEMVREGISPILMHTEIDYKFPLTIYDKPVGTAWVTQLEKMRWEFQFEIACGKRIHATGLQRGTFFDMNKNRPTRVPERLSEQFLRE